MGLFERSRIIAKPGWSRWLVPPAALAIHLSIGQVYAWSVFKTPLEKSLHLSGTQSAIPFQLGILVLGLSAAFGGKLVEHKGPRWAMAVATVCFSAGFLISALGMELSQYWLVVVGYGLVGGIGLGIGYIAPVSTLMKWFPDRPGMATGIAIMGFGGGALIASPWSTQMLAAFGKTTHGIATTFLVHGIVYAIVMSLAVLLVRLPAPGWKPAGWSPEAAAKKSLVTTANVSATNATKTPQFWLLWIVLCFNVTAGIGVLEKAAPMIQDYFKNTSTPVTAAAAAGFVALLSLANMSGRFVWSTLSDLVGRKNIYRFYLGIGVLGYLALRFEASHSIVIFVAATMLLLSFYGGGFSTVPAYLKDLFGTFEVGAIHGRLLTAWSVAGVAGPAIVDAIADAGKRAGNTGPDLYATSFYIMIVLLVIAFVANELIRPVNPRFHEKSPVDGLTPGGTEAAAIPAADEAATVAVAGTDAEAKPVAADTVVDATPAEATAADAAETTPVTEAPVAEAPATEAPATEAPATEAPVVEAPVAEVAAAEPVAAEAESVSAEPVAEVPAVETADTNGVPVPAAATVVTTAVESANGAEPSTNGSASEAVAADDTASTETASTDTAAVDEPVAPVKKTRAKTSSAATATTTATAKTTTRKSTATKSTAAKSAATKATATKATATKPAAAKTTKSRSTATTEASDGADAASAEADTAAAKPKTTRTRSTKAKGAAKTPAEETAETSTAAEPAAGATETAEDTVTR